MTIAAEIPAQATLEQYLQTTYRPDCEYIDGVIEERNLGQWSHARLQAILAGWINQHEREWSCMGAISQRIRVSATRIRVADLVLVAPGRQPSVLFDPPILVIEIVSPEDTYASLEERVTDYRAMGIDNIWIIDPGTRTARMVVDSAWLAVDRLEVSGTLISVDLQLLFARLDGTA